MDQNQIRRFSLVMHELCPDTALCEVFTGSILSDAVHGHIPIKVQLIICLKLLRYFSFFYSGYERSSGFRMGNDLYLTPCIFIVNFNR
jgi:hypothetical protein